MNILKELDNLPVYMNVRYLPQIHLCLTSEMLVASSNSESLSFAGDLKNLELITSMFNSGIFDKKTDVLISDYHYVGADYAFGIIVISEDEAKRLGFINYDSCSDTILHAYDAHEDRYRGAFYRYKQDSNSALMRILKGELDYEEEEKVFKKAYSEVLSGFEVKGIYSLYGGDVLKKRDDGEILIPCQFILDIVDGKTTLEEVSDKIKAIQHQSSGETGGQ